MGVDFEGIDGRLKFGVRLFVRTNIRISVRIYVQNYNCSSILSKILSKIAFEVKMSGKTNPEKIRKKCLGVGKLNDGDCLK